MDPRADYPWLLSVVIRGFIRGYPKSRSAPTRRGVGYAKAVAAYPWLSVVIRGPLGRPARGGYVSLSVVAVVIRRGLLSVGYV